MVEWVKGYMDRWWMDGWWVNGWVDEWMGGWTDEWIRGWMSGWVVNRFVDGQHMDRWINGWERGYACKSEVSDIVDCMLSSRKSGSVCIPGMMTAVAYRGDTHERDSTTTYEGVRVWIQVVTQRVSEETTPQEALGCWLHCSGGGRKY